MSEFPKIQVNDRELWLLKYYDKILPKWECQMWSNLSDVFQCNDTIVEVYLLKERRGIGVTKFIHEFQGYAVVNLDNYLTLPENKILK